MSNSLNYASSFPDFVPLAQKSEKEREEFLFFSPPFNPRKQAFWCPGDSLEESKEVLQQIELGLQPVQPLRGLEVSTGWGMRRVGSERANYLKSLNKVRDVWIENGKVVNEEVAERMYGARNALRQSIRSKSFIPGFAYQTLDVSRGVYRSAIANLGGSVGSTAAEKLRAGAFEDVIRGSYKSNPKFGPSFVRVTKGVGKALGSAGVIVSAVDIPSYAYKSYVAQTKEEQNQALELFASSTASTLHAAICLAMGVGTGGLGILACGILPVFTGMIAGSAARTIANELDQQEGSLFK